MVSMLQMLQCLCLDLLPREQTKKPSQAQQQNPLKPRNAPRGNFQT